MLSGRITAAVAVAALAAFAFVAPASAVEPDEYGVYADWSAAGSSGAYTATGTLAPASGFPSVSVTSNATALSRVSGASVWLNATTDFGAEFGTSRNQPYLNISTAAGQTPSTTTVTFSGDQPAGWGFGLSDIDADWVFVRAWADTARTTQLTVDQLGFQSADNFCSGSPRPSACSAPGLPFESPTWVTAPETFDGVDYVAGTLRGSTLRSPTVTTLDSTGAYGWFKPTAQIRVLEFLFGARDGFPVYSFTIASPAPKATITGAIQSASAIPTDTRIALQNADGTPVLDPLGAPVDAPVEADGSYVIQTEQRPTYILDPVVPPGFVDPPPFTVAADAAEVTAPTIELVAEPVEPQPEPAGEQGDPQLAASGAEGIEWFGTAGAVALSAGILAVWRGRRRREPVRIDRDRPRR